MGNPIVDIHVAKGTKPAGYISDLINKKALRVIGIPRGSLSLVSWRITNSHERPEVPSWMNFPPFFGQKRGTLKVHCSQPLPGLS
jgi:hypothetical protein